MYDIVAKIICETFNEKIGRNGGKQFGFTTPKGLLIEFSTKIDYKTEEGYRYLDLFLFAPMNYVGVFIRDHSTIIKIDAEGELIGDYVTTTGKWNCIGYHDSCWRSSVRELLFQNRDNITGLSTLSGWYEVRDVPEEIFTALNERNN